jgi:two-component system response regulator RstA
MKPKILLIEDDTELATLTQDYLQKNDMTVVIETDGQYAVERIINEQADCVLLDIMLPNKDGFAICREVRDRYHNPILMLTARDEDMDQLLGLELGADDYVCKPVHPRILLARIHALLRRIKPMIDAPQASALRFDQLLIETSSRQVFVQNQLIDFSTAEYDLLLLLAQHAGTVLSRDVILQHLRGIGYDGTDRSVDLRISRIRQKLRNKTNAREHIKTVRGSGYLFMLSKGG